MNLDLTKLGVQRIPGHMPSIMGYFNGTKFKFPCFLVFYAPKTCWIKALKRPRPPIVKVTLAKIVSYLKVQGWYAINVTGHGLRKLSDRVSPEVQTVMFGLDNEKNKFAPESLVDKWPVTKDWLCFFGGRFGRGVCPSTALINAGGEPSPEFVYANLKKDKWI